MATHPPRQGRQNHTRACRELIWPWQRHVPMTAQRSIHRHLRKHLRQKCKIGRQVLSRPVCPRTKCAGHLRRSAWPRWNPADEQRQKFLGKWRRHSTNAICGMRCVRERTTAAFTSAARTASVTRSERNSPNQALTCSRVDQSGAIGLIEKVVLAVSTAEAPTFRDKCETAQAWDDFARAGLGHSLYQCPRSPQFCNCTWPSASRSESLSSVIVNRPEKLSILPLLTCFIAFRRPRLGRSSEQH